MLHRGRLCPPGVPLGHYLNFSLTPSLLFVDHRLRLHRCDLGQDQHGPHPWLGTERTAPARTSAHGHWQTLAFLAALRHDRVDAPCVLDGRINGESFKALSSSSSSRRSSPATLSSWTISAATRPCGAPGHSVCRREASLPPPYSPDLNPIEQAFAKLKTLLRNDAERTAEATWQRMGALLNASHHRSAPTTSETQDMLPPK